MNIPKDLKGPLWGLMFCNCWKSKSLTEPFLSKTVKQWAVLLSTSTTNFPADSWSTFLHDIHSVYNHFTRHRALLCGLSVFKTYTLHIKYHSWQISKFIKQPTWALEFQFTRDGLLATWCSRKETGKGFHTSVWKAVTINRSFTLSALSAPSGSNLAIDQSQGFHLEHPAGCAHLAHIP